MNKITALLSTISVLAAMPVALAQDWTVASVAPVLQTPILTEADADADADDPAIYLHPSDPAQSLVVAAVKNGGIRVYGLDGVLKQTLLPAEDGRINNVDVVYGFTLADGSSADLIIGADRGLDIIRAYRIDADAAEPLTEITDPSATRAFPTRYMPDAVETEDNPVDDQNTVYGLATWNDLAGKTVWVVGTQRHQPTVGVFKLVAGANGVSAQLDHDFRAPATHDGQDLFSENEDDPLLDFSPQFEGTAIDRSTGIIYAGQEDVGIWTVSVTGGEPVLAYATRGSSKSPFNNADSVISRDVEGLTIYYAASGTKYLLASSQGVGTGMELFKTAAGSWVYPEDALFRIGGVPLFSGFMYACVGSYMARIQRIFDIRFSHYPPIWATVVLALAIYVNFFSHHFIYDFRWVLFAVVALLYFRSSMHYRVFRFRHRMPMLLAFLLVALFIWIGENIGTWSRAWIYPDQAEGWSLVSWSKLGSWYLLMLISVVLVTLVHPPKQYEAQT